MKEKTGDGPPPLGSGSNRPLALFDPKVMELDEDLVVEPNPLADQRTPYLEYLLREALSMDKKEVQWLVHHAKSFVIIEGELYKQSHTRNLQRYIPIEQGKQLLRDIHGGVCEHHATPRTLVGNAFRQGFYWLTTVAHAEQIVRTYEGCQYYAWQTHLPAQALQTIPIMWPFMVWGLDLVGPLKRVPEATPTCLSP